MTDEAIREGFEALKDQASYQPLYLAGLSRAIGDWILGMNATRLYTLKYGQNRQVLSIGRVQTPTLALIVNRQKEIDNFKPEPYWVLSTVYRDTLFTATKGKFTSKEEGEAAFSTIADKPFTVTSVEKKNGTEAPKQLFDLTSLQVECNRKFGYSAETTLNIVQTLHRALGLSHLHDPPLYELSLLAGVTTVDDAVGGLHESLNNSKLFLYAAVVDKLYAEARRYHGQRTEAPPLPVFGVVVGLFEGAEVSEGPCHLIAVAFHIAVTGARGSYDAGYILGNAGFLSDTYNHIFLFLLFLVFFVFFLYCFFFFLFLLLFISSIFFLFLLLSFIFFQFQAFLFILSFFFFLFAF